MAFPFLPTNGTGVSSLQLAQARSNYPCVPNIKGQSEPSFSGTFDDLLAQTTNKAALQVQLKNKVKKCSCGKPCAFTLAVCNSCGRSLADTEISYTNNVFMGFIYGLKGLPVSLRYESEDFLCFDDLLAISSAHFNCIPTSVYLPDVRYVLKDPKAGLKLIQSMHDICWQIFVSQFYGNVEWRKKTFKGNPSPEELRPLVITGFNYPPSQYQLHLQFIVPPMMPTHFAMYQQGHHYTHKRFIPFEYIEQVLKLEQPLNQADSMSIGEIIHHFNTLGVEYDAIHSSCYQRYGASQAQLANYDPNDFGAIIVNGTAMYDLKNGAEIAGADVKVVQAADKMALQNYGRPYINSQPSTSYYSFAKKHACPTTLTK
uniref:Uncharacterized protein n=1 Tax=Eutreptiella gymnastica TaxID=73025 RepID=A0A7S1I687_9EUGL